MIAWSSRPYTRRVPFKPHLPLQIIWFCSHFLETGLQISLIALSFVWPGLYPGLPLAQRVSKVLSLCFSNASRAPGDQRGFESSFLTYNLCPRSLPFFCLDRVLLVLSSFGEAFLCFRDVASAHYISRESLLAF